jgi:cytochrome c553
MCARTAIRLATIAFLAAGLGVSLRAEAADAEKGKISYTTFCATCHGESGDGRGPASAALNPPPRDLSKGEFKFDTDKDGATGTDGDLAAVIKNGAAAFGGSLLMTPWVNLTDDDIQNVIAFIRTLKTADAVAVSADTKDTKE